MRIFGNNKVLDWVQKKGMADDEALTHRWLNKALETAQGKVEARNFEIRKNLLRFDDVMNSQRKEIYKERIELMATEDVSDTVAGMRRDVVDALVTRTIPEDVYAEQWKIAELKDEVQRLFGLDLPVDAWAKEEGIADEEIKTRLNDAVERLFAQRAAQYGPDVWRQVEKSVLMQLFDQSWKDHLLHLDHLRQGIGLRAYGQKDPLNEYKREAFNLFNDLLSGLREQVVSLLATLQLRMEPPPMPDMPAQMQEIHEDPALATALSDDPAFDPADPDGGGVATLPRPRAAKAARDPNDPVDLGQGRAQCALPLRLGQEVQALPRAGSDERLKRPPLVHGGLLQGDFPRHTRANFRNSRCKSSVWRTSAVMAAALLVPRFASACNARKLSGGTRARLPTPPSSYDDDASPAALGRLGFPQFAQRVLRAGPD